MSASRSESLIEAKVAVLTPRNRGAIAVIGIWGRDAILVADRVFQSRSGRRLATGRKRIPRLGRVGQGLGDEVVAVVLKSENEPPGNKDQRVEFQCHGGVAACELVLEALEREGATRSSSRLWGDFLRQNPSRRVAWDELPHAPTARVAEILLDQAEGAFDRQIEQAIRDLTIGSARSIERSIRSLEAMLERAQIGRRLIRGWRVVLAGKPNVGKSSLLNALAGFTRSIVDATPGTTRDTVSLPLSFDGWPVELSDTAGLRASADPLEGVGIQRALRAQDEADLVLPVLDISRPLEHQDFDLLRIRSGVTSPIVANKSDLPRAWDLKALGESVDRLILVSAREKRGIESLVRAIGNAIVPNAPTTCDGIPLCESDVEALTEALDAVHSGDRGGALRWLHLALGDQPG